MARRFEECPLRDIFQKGRWRLQKVSGSQPSRYATVTERNYLYQHLDQDKKRLKKSIPESFSYALRPPDDRTEVAKVLKRDIQTRKCPWISTTHKDIYHQVFPKLTAMRQKEIEGPLKESKPQNTDRLICSVTHVPCIRMNCFGEHDLESAYTLHYQDPWPLIFKLPDTDQSEDYDLSRKPDKPVVPYSSKKWKTTYFVEYGQIESKPIENVVFEDYDISNDLIYPIDWSTTYQDYGYSKESHLVTTIPCPKASHCTDLHQIKVEPTSEVERLMKY